MIEFTILSFLLTACIVVYLFAITFSIVLKIWEREDRRVEEQLLESEKAFNRRFRCE